jgi:hypothetical protein
LPCLQLGPWHDGECLHVMLEHWSALPCLQLGPWHDGECLHVRCPEPLPVPARMPTSSTDRHFALVAAVALPAVGEHHKGPGLAPRDEDAFRIIHTDGTHEKRSVSILVCEQYHGSRATGTRVDAHAAICVACADSTTTTRDAIFCGHQIVPCSLQNGRTACARNATNVHDPQSLQLTPLSSPPNRTHDTQVIRYDDGKGVGPERYHGAIGLRRDGTPGWTPDPMPDHEETLQEKQKAHNPNCFNLRRSDSLPLDRAVPDVRKEGCKARTCVVKLTHALLLQSRICCC